MLHMTRVYYFPLPLRQIICFGSMTSRAAAYTKERKGTKENVKKKKIEMNGCAIYLVVYIYLHAHECISAQFISSH